MTLTSSKKSNSSFQDLKIVTGVRTENVQQPHLSFCWLVMMRISKHWKQYGESRKDEKEENKKVGQEKRKRGRRIFKDDENKPPNTPTHNSIKK